MTATASRTNMKCIQDSLGLKNCTYVVTNPDRKSICYKKILRCGKDVDSIQSVIPIAKALLKKKIEYLLTIIYIPLRLRGFAYKLFEHVRGDDQYFPPGCASIPSNRLFAQFHAQQINQMKEEILKQMNSETSIVHVVFATVAIGMGVDIQDIRQVIHIGPPSLVKQSTALLYYNNRDVAKNRVGMQDDMRTFCMSEDVCLRKLLLQSFDYEKDDATKPLHNCCNVCEKECDCPICLEHRIQSL